MIALGERPVEPGANVACADLADVDAPARSCPNPACFGGNVILPVSGRSAICAACDGLGEIRGARETRERYYRGRNTALTLALQSIGAIPEIDTEGEIWI